MTDRYEIKYVLNEIEYSRVLRWIYARTRCVQKHPMRTVHGLYFDDNNFTFAEDNISGIGKRKKVRFRWYESRAGEFSGVVLEIKTKNGRLGAKKRIELEVAGESLMSAKARDVLNQSGIFDSHETLLNISSGMNPVLYVKYIRRYFESIEGVRLTIDEDIRFSQMHALNSINQSRKIFYAKKVLEIKFSPNERHFVAKMLDGVSMVQKRHSKYLVGLAITGQAIYI